MPPQEKSLKCAERECPGDSVPVPACDLCGATAAQWRPTWPEAPAASETAGFVTCLRCGLTFCARRPGDMVEFHRRQYAAEAGDDTPRRIGKHDPEYSRRKQYAPEYQRKAARLLRRAASFCAPAGAGPVRYLEVGCASGGMLKAARDRGFAATGVEISAEAAAYGLNHERLDIRIGRMEEHRFADSAFDLVMVYDVLEHVSSPAALLTECARVLAPGGALCVHTACGERSWTARLAGHRYFLADPSGGHIVLFSPGTLRRYVERAGLEVAGVSTHGFRWIQTEAERARHGLCRRLARPLENAAHELARLFGGGHFVFLFARKPTRIRADRGSL